MLNSTLGLGFLFGFGGLFSSDNKIIGLTEYGKVEGTTSTGRDGRTIYEFLGIPYAIPPVGDLRFRPPIEWNTSWNDIRDATSYGSKCKQFHLIAKYISGNEDCLYLNVYTHQYQKDENDTSEDNQLSPVMVYIHGGLFMHGAGEWYKPKYLLDSDVVLVTINYRVGVFGFLNLGDEDIQGNMGLKDQVAALKWIQRNIQNFGGDPNKVTLMGESAGGACVHYHILSPMSQGLFHRGISQSGTALVSWASQDDPQEQAMQLISQMNCMKLTMAKIARCLRALDADKLAQSQRAAADLLHDRYALYSPTIEVAGEGAFISDLPQDIIKSGNFSKVPWVVGVNSEEGLIYSAPILRNETVRVELNKNWTTWAPLLFRFADEPDKDIIAEKIRLFYFGNTTTEINMARLHNLTTFLSDRSFFEGLHNTLTLHKGQHPIYPYVYSHEGRFSFAKLLFGMTFALPVAADVVVSRSWKWFQSTVLRIPETSYGVAHGDELPLIFNLPFQKELNKGKTFGDYDISVMLVNSWATFARDGIPSPMRNVSWPDLSSDFNRNANERSLSGNYSDDSFIVEDPPMKFLKINRNTEIVDEPFHSRAYFWANLNLLPYKLENIQNTANDKNCTQNSENPLCDNDNLIIDDDVTDTRENEVVDSAYV